MTTTQNSSSATLRKSVRACTVQALKASGLEGDYRILTDFNGTVLAGTHSKHSVQFVTWDWDYNRTGFAYV